jgi:hypothetical protein
MKYRIGFTVLLGACYLLLALQASFGITAAHFWPDMLAFFCTLLVLPLAVFSIWKVHLAGRLLLIDAGVMASTALFHVDAKDEASVAILVALPIAFAGLLLLKKQSAPLGPNE